MRVKDKVAIVSGAASGMGAETARVLPRVEGGPVYLALAMDAAQRVRAKPQNLATGLPLIPKEAGA